MGEKRHSSGGQFTPVLLVDAYNLFLRHFVANPSLASSGARQGESVGGIVGFLNTLRWLIDSIHSGQVVVVWESGGSTRKRRIFAEYKSRRRPQKLNRYYEDDLPNTIENKNWQIATIVSILQDLGICQVYVPDCEADDVIAYIARYKFPKRRKVILSSDKDFYQLLSEDIQIYNPMGKRFVVADDVLTRFGVAAHNFCVAKAICGDPSDNVPGIKGVGFKTVSKRFPILGTSKKVSIQDILDEATSRMNSNSNHLKVYRQIVDGKDVIYRNWKLMNLDVNVLTNDQIRKIDHVVDTFVPQWNKMSLIRKMMKEGLELIDVDQLFLTCKTYLTNQI